MQQQEVADTTKLDDIKQDEDQDKNEAIAIIGSLIDNKQAFNNDFSQQSDDELPLIEEQTNFEDEVMPNIRLSIRKEIDENQDPFAYAMHFLYKNFSDVTNLDRFPEMVEVPKSVTPEAVLLPSVSAYQPPDSILHFKAGNFS